ncbi:hypothetical protein V8C86DRAFT_1781297, partial [Haematococcus lacustris]
CAPHSPMPDACLLAWNDVLLVCAGLLYLFGLHLDYSDALIGGGFKFQNPNATDSCG